MKPHYSGTGGKAIVARISQVAQPARARLYSLLHALGTLETHLLTELGAEPLESSLTREAESLRALLREEIATQTAESRYCWWCEADINGTDGPAEPHKAACWFVRVSAEVREPSAPPTVFRMCGPGIPSGTGPLVDRNGDPV